jgi:hypothetical protein
VKRIVSEREMRTRDRARSTADAARTTAERPGERAEQGSPPDDGGEPLFGVHLGGVHRAQLHYPDLLLIAEYGRVAIELALTSTPRRQLEAILTGYGADPSVAVVLYLVADPTIGQIVQSTAARVGLSALVRVHSVRIGRSQPVPMAQ